MAFRFDAVEVTGLTRLPSGAVRVDARPTKSGVFPYRRADGSIVREYRPPEEVLAPASLATLRGVPLTWMHPVEPVTAANWKALAIGHVSDDVRAAPPYAETSVIVSDAENIARIAETKEAGDLSCGYAVDLDDTPGTTPEGEPYDVVQRNIVYNHVALLPKGAGRLGRDVSLRADSAACIVAEMATHKIDGKEYEAGSADHIAAVDRKIGQLAADLAAVQKRADAAEAKASPEAIRTAAKERASLLARAMRDGVKLDSGKRLDEGGDDEILLSILKKAYPELDFGKLMLSHEQMMAFLAQSVGGASPEAPADGMTPPEQTPPPGAGTPPPPPRTDAAEARIDAARGKPGSSNVQASTPRTERDAIREREEKTRNAWKGN